MNPSCNSDLYYSIDYLDNFFNEAQSNNSICIMHFNAVSLIKKLILLFVFYLTQ